MVGRGLKRLLKQDEFKYGLKPLSKHGLTGARRANNKGIVRSFTMRRAKLKKLV